MRLRSAFGLALLFCATAAFAASPRLPDPNAVRTYSGAVNVHTEGTSVIVALSRDAEGSVETIFHVDSRDAARLGLSLQAKAAQVVTWTGHLLVLVPDQGQALHFSIPGFESKVRLSLVDGKDLTRIDPAALDARLEQTYRLTTLDSASEIGSRTGQLPIMRVDDQAAQAHWLAQSRPPLRHQAGAMNTEPYQPDTGSGSGGGSSCSQSCPNGASCSITCPAGNANGGGTVATCNCNGLGTNLSCTCN